MNNKTIAVIAVVGIGAYFLLKGNGESGSPSYISSGEGKGTIGSGVSGTLEGQPTYNISFPQFGGFTTPEGQTDNTTKKEASSTQIPNRNYSNLDVLANYLTTPNQTTGVRPIDAPTRASTITSGGILTPSQGYPAGGIVKGSTLYTPYVKKTSIEGKEYSKILLAPSSVPPTRFNQNIPTIQRPTTVTKKSLIEAGNQFTNWKK